MQHEQFAAHAALEERHWWFTARRQILRTVLAVVAPPDRGTALVDFGCGTGGNAAALAAHYRVLAIDPSAEAIALAEQRFPAVHFVRGDDPVLARPHLAAGGVVLMADVLEHVADDAGLLRQMVDIVPAGGHLLLTVPADPALWSRHDIAFGHHRRYDLATLRDLWRTLPVTERLLSPFNVRLRPLIAAARGLRRGEGGDLRRSPQWLDGILRRVFAGESIPLRDAVDRGAAPYARGVSLIALLSRS